MDGLKMKYRIQKADGRAVDPQGIYFVLKLNSDDQAHGLACRRAARCYAMNIHDSIPELAEDLDKLCDRIEAGNADGLFPKGGTE